MKKIFSSLIVICVLLSMFTVQSYAKGDKKSFYGTKERNINGLIYKIDNRLYRDDISNEDFTGYIYSYKKKEPGMPRFCIEVDNKKLNSILTWNTKKDVKKFIKNFAKSSKLGTCSKIKIKPIRSDETMKVFHAKFNIADKYKAQLYTIGSIRGWVTLWSFQELNDFNNYNLDRIYQSINLDSFVLYNSNIKSLTATYTGGTTSGVVIDDNNDSIKLNAKLDDDRVVAIPGSLWTIENPQTLQPDQSYTFNIKYSNQGKELETTFDVKCSTMSPEKQEASFKASCEKPTYENLMRTPETYDNHSISMTGKVMQVQDDVFLVQVSQDEYGLWDDIVMVDDLRNDSSVHILEDDIITFYGSYQGTTKYETVMGDSKTVPLVYAGYIDLN